MRRSHPWPQKNYVKGFSISPFAFSSDIALKLLIHFSLFFINRTVRNFCYCVSNKANLNIKKIWTFSRWQWNGFHSCPSQTSFWCINVRRSLFLIICCMLTSNSSPLLQLRGYDTVKLLLYGLTGKQQIASGSITAAFPCCWYFASVGPWVTADSLCSSRTHVSTPLPEAFMSPVNRLISILKVTLIRFSHIKLGAANVLWS